MARITYKGQYNWNGSNSKNTNTKKNVQQNTKQTPKQTTKTNPKPTYKGQYNWNSSKNTNTKKNVSTKKQTSTKQTATKRPTYKGQYVPKVAGKKTVVTKKVPQSTAGILTKQSKVSNAIMANKQKPSVANHLMDIQSVSKTTRYNLNEMTDAIKAKQSRIDLGKGPISESFAKKNNLEVSPAFEIKNAKYTSIGGVPYVNIRGMAFTPEQAKKYSPESVADIDMGVNKAQRDYYKNIADSLHDKYKATSKYNPTEEAHRLLISEYDKYKNGQDSAITAGEIQEVKKLIASGQYDKYKKKWQTESEIKRRYKNAAEMFGVYDDLVPGGVEFDEDGKLIVTNRLREATDREKHEAELLAMNNVSPIEQIKAVDYNTSEQERADINRRLKLRGEHATDALIEGEKRRAYEYYQKHSDNEYGDNLFGRAAGNYRVGRVGTKTNDTGYINYMNNSADIEAAEVYQHLAKTIQENNEGTFKNEGFGEKTWGNLWQYAPQMVDQTMAALPGMIVGGAINPFLGTAVSSVGQAEYMFRQTAGGAFIRNIQQNGLSVEDAKALSKNEALASGAIEFGLSMVMGGIGNGASKLAETAGLGKKIFKALIDLGVSEKGAKIILNSAKTAGKIAYDNLGEALEEGWQEGVSITADHGVKNGDMKNPFELLGGSLNLGQYSDEEKAQIKDAAMASLFTGIGRAGARGAINLVGSGYAKTRDYNDFKNAGSFIMELPGSDDIIMNTIELGMQSEKEGTRKAAEILDNLYMADKMSPAKLGGLVTQVMAEGKDVFDIKENDTKYSITNIKGNNGDYGTGVYLDTDIFKNTKPRNWGSVLSKFVYDKLAGQTLDVYDEQGNLRPIQFAKKNERVLKDGANNSHRVIDKLARTKGNAQILSVVHIDELLQTSQLLNENKENNHQWLDERGWEHRTTYLQDIKGRIYEATLNIARAKDGRDILYNISNVKEVDAGAVPSHLTNRGSHISSTSKYSISQDNPFVNSLNQKNTSIDSELIGNTERVFNAKVLIDDSLEYGADGYYKGGVLHLSKNAKRPLDFVLSHELTHHMQRLDKGSYNGFRMIALRYTAQQRGMTIDELIAEKREIYKKVGLSKGEAIDEIATDFAGEHMSGEKLQDLIRRIESGELIENTEQGRNIIQKFIDAIRDFVERIKIRYSAGKYFDKAIELETVIDAYEQLAVGAANNKDKSRYGKTVYNLKDDDSIAKSFDIQKLNDYIHVQRKVIQTLKDEGFFTDENSVSRKVVNQKSGMVVEITPKGIKETFGEKNYMRLSRTLKNAKLSTVRNLPELIEHGVLTADDIANEHNVSSGLKYAYIKADAVVGDIPVRVRIAVRKSPQKNQFWVHQIDIIKNSDEDIPAGAESSKTGVQSLITDNSISHDDKDVKYLISEENGIDSEFDSEEVADLKDTIRFLRSRSEYLQGKVVSPSTVLSNAKDIVSEYNSGISARELAISLSKLYKEVAQAQLAEDGDMMLMFNKARDIARNVLNQSKGIQQEMPDEVRYMRNHIRTVGISLTDEDKLDFGSRADWNDFRKANFGRIKISNKGLPVDTFYKELADLYPEYFSEEQYTHPADQMRHIAKVLDETQATTMIDGIEMDSEATEMMLATEILEKYSNAEAEDRSVISEIEKIDRETKREYEGKRQADRKELAAWYKEKYKKVMEERKFDRDLLEAENKEKVRKIRGERRAADEKKKLLNLLKYFDKLKTTPERLDSIKAKMNEGELKSFRDVEEFAGKTPEEIVRMLDSWGVRLMEEGYERVDGVKVMGRLELSELEEEYNMVKEADPDFLPNRQLEAKFKRLHNIQIDTLDEYQVRDLIELLAGVKTQIENENKILLAKEEKRVDEVTKKVHRELKDGKKFMDSKMGVGGITDKGPAEKWKLWQFNANTVFKKLSGYLPHSEFNNLAEELREAQRRKAGFERTAERHFEGFFEKHPELRRTLRLQKKEKWIEIKHGWKISPGMRIALYLHSKNVSNMESIRDFGVTIPKEALYRKGKKKDAFNQGETIKLSQKDIREITKGMTAEEREFADKYAYTFFNGVTTKHINEVSRVLLGYDVAVVRDYFPKNSDMNMVESENIGTYDILSTVEGWGALKHRTGGKPVLLLDVYDVIDKTISGTSKYYGLGLAMRDVRKVLGKSSDGGKTTLGVIAELHGEDVKSWMEDLLRDMENPRVSQQLAKARARGIKNAFAGSTLTARVNTLLKQGGAFFVGMPEVGAWNLAWSTHHHVNKQDIKLWEDASTAFWQRGTDLKKYDPRAWIENLDKYWVQRLNAAIMVGIEKDFNIARPKIPYSKKSQVWNEYYKKMRQPEVMAEIEKRIDNMINNTQSVYSTMERPTILRDDKNLLKHFLPFRTQNFQDYNMLTQNIQELRALTKYKKQGKATKEELNEARRKCANTIAGLTLNHVYGSVATLLGNTILGQKFAKRYETEGEDEEEERKMYEELSPFWQGVNDIFNRDEKGVITPESVKDRMVTDIINGFAGEFMFCDEVVNYIDSIVSDKKYYELEIGTVSMIFDALLQLKNTADVVKDMGTNDFSIKLLAESFIDLGAKGSALIGVPGSNIQDIVDAAIFHLSGAVEGANKNFDKAIYFNPYKLQYDVWKDAANINKDKAWFSEKFFDAAKFAVKVKNPENRQKAYEDLNKMYWEMSEQISDKKERESFQEKLLDGISKLEVRNADAIKRALGDRESWVKTQEANKKAVDAEIKRLDSAGIKIDFDPGARAVLKYDFIDYESGYGEDGTYNEGNKYEKSITLTPIESIWYAKDVEKMIYYAYSEAMNGIDWDIRTNEEREHKFKECKQDAIDLVKKQYIKRKTGDLVASTPFEKFQEEFDFRKDEQSLDKISGNKYVTLGDSNVQYELPYGLAKEYDAAIEGYIKDIGEDIFTNKVEVTKYITGIHKEYLFYDEMTPKQRQDTLNKSINTKKNKASATEKQQQTADFINGKKSYQKDIEWGGTVDDFTPVVQDKLYKKIKEIAKEKAQEDFSDRIQAEARVVYTRGADKTWTAEVNGQSEANKVVVQYNPQPTEKPEKKTHKMYTSTLELLTKEKPKKEISPLALSNKDFSKVRVDYVGKKFDPNKKEQPKQEEAKPAETVEKTEAPVVVEYNKQSYRSSSGKGSSYSKGGSSKGSSGGSKTVVNYGQSNTSYTPTVNYGNKNVTTKTVRVSNTNYSRANINTKNIGTTYRRVSKAPVNVSYDHWRQVMTAWNRVLSSGKFTDEDLKLLDITVSDANALLKNDSESIAAAVVEWMEYGEAQGFDTKEFNV